MREKSIVTLLSLSSWLPSIVPYFLLWVFFLVVLVGSVFVVFCVLHLGSRRVWRRAFGVFETQQHLEPDDTGIQ